MILPLASETVEVLWVLEDDRHFWWRAIVLDIKESRKGSTIATAKIQYEPGPHNHDSTVHIVNFRKDHTVSCVKRKRGDPRDENTWRFPVEDDNCDSDNPDKLSEKNQENENTVREQPSSVALHSINGVGYIQDQKVSELEKGLESALDRVSVVESMLDALRSSSSVNSTQFIVSDIKKFLRRALVEKFMIPMRNLGKEKLPTKQSKFYSITCKIDCSLRVFQLLVKDISEQCNEDREDSIKNVSFLPSRLSILHASYSVPSFYIKLRRFKQVCDYLKIRDLRDREQFITKTSIMSSGTECALRVIGTGVNGNSDGDPTIYLIGNDYSLPASVEDHCILYREGSAWDEENNRFVHSVKNMEGSSSINISDANELKSLSDEFNLVWERKEDLKSKTWSYDVTRNPDSQLGELKLTIPVILLHGKTAIEIDSFLTKSFTDKVLISSTTSFPPSFN